MTYLVGQMFFCLLIAVLLGIVLAWLWSKVTPPKIEQPIDDELSECQAKLENLQTEHDECPARLRKAHRDLQRTREDLNRLESRLKAYQKLHAPKLPARYGGPADGPDRASGPSSDRELSNAMAYEVLLNRAHRLQEALHQSQAELEGITGEANGSGHPEGLLETPPSSADNLEEISGVGPVLHQKLNQLGIYQFRQIANFSSQDTAWLANQLQAFKNRMTRDDWVGQARDLYHKKYGNQG